MNQLEKLESVLEHNIRNVDAEINRLMSKTIISRQDQLEVYRLTGELTAYSAVLVWAINNRIEK